MEGGPVPGGLTSSEALDAIGKRCKTCAMPMSPIMSSGEANTVRDFDRVSPTVMRPRQSSVSSVGEPSG